VNRQQKEFLRVLAIFAYLGALVISVMMAGIGNPTGIAMLVSLSVAGLIIEYVQLGNKE
jgi:hypothetical protein